MLQICRTNNNVLQSKSLHLAICNTGVMMTANGNTKIQSKFSVMTLLCFLNTLHTGNSLGLSQGDGNM